MRTLSSTEVERITLLIKDIFIFMRGGGRNWFLKMEGEMLGIYY